MWADDNVYSTENGGKYKFIEERDVKLAIPDGQSLWDDLMSNKTEHGIPLHVYEQDWMYNEWQVRNKATRFMPCAESHKPPPTALHLHKTYTRRLARDE
eukprot:SAG11_NODE_2359_length_3464_cov_2.039525_3_plen_99_part_00